MNPDTKEFYMARTAELETEVHYLAEILNQIILRTDSANVKALASAGHNAYVNKRKIKK